MKQPGRLHGNIAMHNLMHLNDLLWQGGDCSCATPHRNATRICSVCVMPMTAQCQLTHNCTCGHQSHHMCALSSHKHQPHAACTLVTTSHPAAGNSRACRSRH
jgi:hypothetical protein